MLSVIKEISEGIWAIDRTYADRYMIFINSLLKGTFNQNNIEFSAEREKHFPMMSTLDLIDEAGFRRGDNLEYAYTKADFNTTTPFIAFFNLNGPITKYDQFSGGYGMSSYAKWLDRAYANTNLKAVVFKIDSGGGNGFASDLMSETIKRSPVPTIAYIEDVGASAAYQIAASCSIVIANKDTALIGSIGTYVTVADYSKSFEKEGIAITEVYADESTEKNKEYYDAIAGDLAGMKARVNRWNDSFLAEIKQNRKGKLTDDSWRTGKLFFAEKALEVGLIDEIKPFNQVLKELVSQLNIK